MTITPTIFDNLLEKQTSDQSLQRIKQEPLEGKNDGFRIADNGILYLRDRLCIPGDIELRRRILEEAHSTPYAMHPGSTKMYQDLKKKFWWSGMKRDVAQYVSTCLTCQRVKAEHQRPGGLLQLVQIPE